MVVVVVVVVDNLLPARRGLHLRLSVMEGFFVRMMRLKPAVLTDADADAALLPVHHLLLVGELVVRLGLEGPRARKVFHRLRERPNTQWLQSVIKRHDVSSMKMAGQSCFLFWCVESSV